MCLGWLVLVVGQISVDTFQVELDGQVPLVREQRLAFQHCGRGKEDLSICLYYKECDHICADRSGNAELKKSVSLVQIPSAKFCGHQEQTASHTSPIPCSITSAKEVIFSVVYVCYSVC